MKTHAKFYQRRRKYDEEVIFDPDLSPLEKIYCLCVAPRRKSRRGWQKRPQGGLKIRPSCRCRRSLSASVWTGV